MNKWLNSNLTEEEIQDRYGHGLSEDQIKSLYPYENGELKGEYGGQDYTITYDPLTAYALRKRFPVVVWGKIKKNHRAFVFRKRKPIMLEF